MSIMQLDKIDLRHTTTAIMADERGIRWVRMLPPRTGCVGGARASKELFLKLGVKECKN